MRQGTWWLCVAIFFFLTEFNTFGRGIYNVCDLKPDLEIVWLPCHVLNIWSKLRGVNEICPIRTSLHLNLFPDRLKFLFEDLVKKQMAWILWNYNVKQKILNAHVDIRQKLCWKITMTRFRVLSAVIFGCWFICTGIQHTSPMSEYLLNSWSKDILYNVNIITYVFVCVQTPHKYKYQYKHDKESIKYLCGLTVIFLWK